MSLRKTPELTPELLEAARRNAQQATGPRTAAGKQNVKMNAVRHGVYAADENHRLAMLALGEDPQEFEALEQELMTTYGPGDALWRRQIEDLAKLYWRRQRMERMQTGVMLRALQEVEERQHRREREMANARFEPSQPEMLETAAAEPSDEGVRLRWILSALGVIRGEVAQRGETASKPVGASSAGPGPNAVRPYIEVCGSSAHTETSGRAQARESAQPAKDGPTSGTQSAIDNRQSTISNRQTTLEILYRGMMGWRVARISRLLRRFSDSSEATGQQNGGARQAGDAEMQELLGLLDEEIAAVEQEFEYAEKVNAEKAAIERDACLAPEGETWRMMLRQESALDRSIDRKVKIVLGLRKQFSDDNLTVDAGRDEDNDREMQEIARSMGPDSSSDDWETPEPPELQILRNKPGISMKTKSHSPKRAGANMPFNVCGPVGSLRQPGV